MSLPHSFEQGGRKLDSRNSFYVSPNFAAKAESAGAVSVIISVRSEMGPLGASSAESETTGEAKAGLNALKNAAAEFFRHRFGSEIEKVVDAYRVMLRESLAKGEDPELQAALNRARLQEKILASTSMVDQTQACQLLGLSGANPSATMKRKEDKREILRFTIDGRAMYPLFQFDVEGRRPFPAIARLIAKKPKSWSDFRLLHWLTRPHLDFDGTPAEGLRVDEEAVIAAFDREIEPAVHG